MEITHLASLALGIFLSLMTLLFLGRIVLSWYPKIDLRTLPWSLVAIPTEPFLAPLRRLVPPLGGVDITPVIWLGVFTLLREILLGQQGLITMAIH